MLPVLCFFVTLLRDYLFNKLGENENRKIK